MPARRLYEMNPEEILQNRFRRKIHDTLYQSPDSTLDRKEMFRALGRGDWTVRRQIIEMERVGMIVDRDGKYKLNCYCQTNRIGHINLSPPERICYYLTFKGGEKATATRICLQLRMSPRTVSKYLEILGRLGVVERDRKGYSIAEDYNFSTAPALQGLSSLMNSAQSA